MKNDKVFVVVGLLASIKWTFVQQPTNNKQAGAPYERT